MKVYLDTNVLLDHFLGRPAAGTEATTIIAWGLEGRYRLSAIANAFTMAYFYQNKVLQNPEAVKHNLAMLRQYVDVVPVDGATLDAALRRNLPADLEDAIQIQAAINNGADVFITSDQQLRKTKIMRMMSPKQFIKEHMFNY